jgi:hypothetical protein
MMVTEAQERALAVSLRSIETQLAWMERLLGWTYRGVLLSFEDDLDESARAALRSGIDEVSAQLRAWTCLFHLTPEVVPKSRWIVGHLTQLWVVTEECQTPHLRGYGHVTPELAEQVDPAARRLGHLLLEMQRIAQTKTCASTSPRDVAR